MKDTILVTGGTGFIGSHLINTLINEGYKVHIIGRTDKQIKDTKHFKWDIKHKKIDPKCIKGVSTIIHLAGAGIADKRWTKTRKQEITASRTEPINLIYELLKQEKHQVKRIIAASAAGYYSDRGDEILDESAFPNNDFLGKCCLLWENAVDAGKAIGLQTVKLRTGIVLDKNKGALAKMVVPFKFGMGSVLGNGKQWMSWIHIKDLVNMYLFFIKNELLEGVYNASAPYPVTNKYFSKVLAKQLCKPLWLPSIPPYILKLALGEMSIILLSSTRMNAEKIMEIGFNFEFPHLDTALRDIYK